MRERLYNFDLLKIIAAILIVFHHYQQLADVSFKWINFYGGLFSFGYLVELFFIISGFLAAMTSSHKDGIFKPVCKRIKRILPMAFLAVLFNCIVFMVYKVITGSYMFDTDYSILQILTSLFLVNQGWIVEFFPAVNNPIWYLCVLLWLSILYAAICTVVKGNKKIEVLISFAMICLGILGWKLRINLPFLHLSDFRGYTTFFMGICLYHVYNMVSRKLCFAIGIGLTLSSVIGMNLLGVNSWYVLVAFLFPGIVLLAASVPQINKVNISVAGGVSYEVYLWHMPMYCLLKLFIDVIGIEISHSYLTMTIFTIFVWGISFYLFQYGEKSIDRIIGKIHL